MHLHACGFNWVESGRYVITSCRAERAHVKNPFNLRVVEHVQNRQRHRRSRPTSSQSLLQRYATLSEAFVLKVIHWPLRCLEMLLTSIINALVVLRIKIRPKPNYSVNIVCLLRSLLGPRLNSETKELVFKDSVFFGETNQLNHHLEFWDSNL